MKKKLVAYFSATGTTRRAAEALAEAAGAGLYEIRAAAPYTAADLDWTNRASRSSVEAGDPKARPELADSAADVASCFSVFPYGGIRRRRSSAPFWNGMTFQARPSCCLPLPAAAVWDRQRKTCGRAVRGRCFRTDGF